MARLAAGQKAAQARALTAARAALKAGGAAETGSGTARRTTTASGRDVHHSHSAGVRLRKVRLRKIRLRG